MELHQLRYVAAVARTANFSRAAEQCHVAQPSLSQQIHKLEEELGELLFVRMKRAVTLTPAGETFLRRAQTILSEVEAAKREAGEAGQLLRGTLTIGVLPTIAPYLLPDAIFSFSSKFPGVELIVQEDTTERLLRQTLAGGVDLAIVSLPLAESRLEVRTLFEEELLLALPLEHPLTRQRSIRPADLDGQRLIVLQEGHCLGDQVLHFCDRNHACPCISFRSAQLETVLALVRAGMGISLVPAMAIRKPRPDAPVFRSLTAPRPQRTMVAVWPKCRPLGRAAAEFLKGVHGPPGRTRT
jgi:LysR family hydrogen peroxide-inducible transcriptional activator